jgi:hypothetical protein
MQQDAENSYTKKKKFGSLSFGQLCWEGTESKWYAGQYLAYFISPE